MYFKQSFSIVHLVSVIVSHYIQSTYKNVKQNLRENNVSPWKTLQNDYYDICVT